MNDDAERRWRQESEYKRFKKMFEKEDRVSVCACVRERERDERERDFAIKIFEEERDTRVS